MENTQTAIAWEYRFARMEMPGFNDDDARNLASLNRFGSDGWEAVNVIPAYESKDNLPIVLVLMKRPKQ